MKTFLKIVLGILIISSSIITHAQETTNVDFSKVGGGLNKIEQVSIKKDIIVQGGTSNTGNPIADTLSNFGFKILKTVKIVFGGVFLILMVYAGIQMIMSMGTDDNDLGKAKKSIWYSLIGLLFINIPGTLYDAFNVKNKGTIDGRIGYSSFTRTPQNSDSNIFIDVFSFGLTLNQYIIGFIEVGLGGAAVVMITLAGVNILTARGREDQVSEAKTKITWSLIGLMFLGFIEAWKYIVFGGNVDDGKNLFETIGNLALFFAGPVAICFLTLAGYYYVTSAGEEDKVKKAKSIVINTVIATVILLASYTFLLDLATL